MCDCKIFKKKLSTCQIFMIGSVGVSEEILY